MNVLQPSKFSGYNTSTINTWKIKLNNELAQTKPNATNSNLTVAVQPKNPHFPNFNQNWNLNISVCRSQWVDKYSYLTCPKLRPESPENTTKLTPKTRVFELRFTTMVDRLDKRPLGFSSHRRDKAIATGIACNRGQNWKVLSEQPSPSYLRFSLIHRLAGPRSPACSPCWGEAIAIDPASIGDRTEKVSSEVSRLKGYGHFDLIWWVFIPFPLNHLDRPDLAVIAINNPDCTAIISNSKNYFP